MLRGSAVAQLTVSPAKFRKRPQGTRAELPVLFLSTRARRCAGAASVAIDLQSVSQTVGNGRQTARSASVMVMQYRFLQP